MKAAALMYDTTKGTLSDVTTLDQQSQVYSRDIKKKKEEEDKERRQREPLRSRKDACSFEHLEVAG